MGFTHQPIHGVSRVRRPNLSVEHFTVPAEQEGTGIGINT
jgi:hypothetical protein